MSASFVPDHKAPMVLFLDRVYGIDNQDFLLHVLEVGFLPDMRAAASLDTVSINTKLELLQKNRQWKIYLSLYLLSPGCFQHHRDGPCFEPLPVFCCAAAHHQMCPSVCWQWSQSNNDRLHVTHYLSAVTWASLHQSPKRHHRGVSHGTVQVSLTSWSSFFKSFQTVM